MITNPTTPSQALKNAIHAAESANMSAARGEPERSQAWSRVGELWLGVAKEMSKQAPPTERVTVK